MKSGSFRLFIGPNGFRLWEHWLPSQVSSRQINVVHQKALHPADWWNRAGVFTLCAHRRLYCNAVIAGWGEAAVCGTRRISVVFFFFSQTLLKDWIMPRPASYCMRNSSPWNSSGFCSGLKFLLCTGSAHRAVCSAPVVFWSYCRPVSPLRSH